MGNFFLLISAASVLSLSSSQGCVVAIPSSISRLTVRLSWPVSSFSWKSCETVTMSLSLNTMDSSIVKRSRICSMDKVWPTIAAQCHDSLEVSWFLRSVAMDLKDCPSIVLSCSSLSPVQSHCEGPNLSICSSKEGLLIFVSSPCKSWGSREGMFLWVLFNILWIRFCWKPVTTSLGWEILRPPIEGGAATLALATRILFWICWPSFCLVHRKLVTFLNRLSQYSEWIGIAIKTWLYNGKKAVLISSDLCRRSVGGVVAKILRCTALGEMCSQVCWMVDWSVLPSCMPRCLMCSGVLIPSWWSPWTMSGGVLMQSAAVLLRLIFKPLTFLKSW